MRRERGSVLEKVCVCKTTVEATCDPSNGKKESVAIVTAGCCPPPRPRVPPPRPARGTRPQDVTPEATRSIAIAWS